MSNSEPPDLRSAAGCGSASGSPARGRVLGRLGSASASRRSGPARRAGSGASAAMSNSEPPELGLGGGLGSVSGCVAARSTGLGRSRVLGSGSRLGLRGLGSSGSARCRTASRPTRGRRRAPRVPRLRGSRPARRARASARRRHRGRRATRRRTLARPWRRARAPRRRPCRTASRRTTVGLGGLGRFRPRRGVSNSDDPPPEALAAGPTSAVSVTVSSVWVASPASGSALVSSVAP